MLGSISLPAGATAAHSWVDAEGVVNFSDTPPADGAIVITTVELADDFPPAVDPEAEYYSIANQWKRMREEREARTKLILEKARVRESRPAPAAYSGSPPEYALYPSYPVYARGYPFYAPRYGYNPGYGRDVFQHGHRGSFGRGSHHFKSRGGHFRERAGDLRSPARGAVGFRGGTGTSIGVGLR